MELHRDNFEFFGVYKFELLFSWIHLLSVAIGNGIFSGIVVLLTTRGKSSRILEFNEQLFFIYLLPTIIFNAGTWGNLNSVVHIINALTLTCFGSDVVLKQDETPLLYSLVFGGGLVNDASSVVLFNAIKKLDLSHYFNRCHSVSSKLLSFVLEKHITGNCSKSLSNKHLTDYEVVSMILMAYLSNKIAELLFLSGILSVFFCGVVMSHYTSWNNGNGSSKLIPRHAFATLSFVAEIFIFLCVGMDALDIEKWNVVRESHGKSVGASFILLGLVLVGRAAFFAIWWAGLTRGAASVALAYHQV
ncbi:sodium/hydrogen exchanger 3-like [Cucumis melo]|uniref:Sodium/hydrogen exchanger 3-like n=1 Tax=Cucumis melo TaxID=3656 RepID=A0ABM3KLA8_CUCME|nr:sodium/hydrogen exchanger 3-like [Cucumis melo]